MIAPRPPRPAHPLHDRRRQISFGPAVIQPRTRHTMVAISPMLFRGEKLLMFTCSDADDLWLLSFTIAGVERMPILPRAIIPCAAFRPNDLGCGMNFGVAEDGDEIGIEIANTSENPKEVHVVLAGTLGIPRPKAP